MAGVLVVDRYNAYARAPCKLQYCYAHLMRDVEDLAKEFPDSTEVQAFTATLIPLLSAAMHLHAQPQDLLSDEHFTVDGTLIEAWAGQKSFRKKEGGEASPPPDDSGNPTVNFHGEKRSNQTHESTTDRDARLYRKSKGSEAKLAYLGHVLMENRNGLLVDAMLTQADGRAERDAARLMAWRHEAGHTGRRQEL